VTENDVGLEAGEASDDGTTLLWHLASHGFVVIVSNNTNVAWGDPAPMLVGVKWVLKQNDDPSRAHRLNETCTVRPCHFLKRQRPRFWGFE
jgi:hypothetical protein